ncbi:unnamed protein product [Amoebophrya sp. A120]|nr:unnamed protein product [Amoebophrya sp. A120]|eukprot:GSA120T00015913001.1
MRELRSHNCSMKTTSSEQKMRVKKKPTVISRTGKKPRSHARASSGSSSGRADCAPAPQDCLDDSVDSNCNAQVIDDKIDPASSDSDEESVDLLLQALLQQRLAARFGDFGASGGDEDHCTTGTSTAVRNNSTTNCELAATVEDDAALVQDRRGTSTGTSGPTDSLRDGRGQRPVVQATAGQQGQHVEPPTKKRRRGGKKRRERDSTMLQDEVESGVVLHTRKERPSTHASELDAVFDESHSKSNAKRTAAAAMSEKMNAESEEQKAAGSSTDLARGGSNSSSSTRTPGNINMTNPTTLSKQAQRKMRNQWLRGDLSKMFSEPRIEQAQDKTLAARVDHQHDRSHSHAAPTSEHALTISDKDDEKKYFNTCVNELRDLAYTSLSKKKKWQFTNAKLEALGGKVRPHHGAIPFNVLKRECANRKEKVKRLNRRDEALGVQTSVVKHKSRHAGLGEKKRELNRKKQKKQGHLEMRNVGKVGQVLGNKMDKTGLQLSGNYLKKLGVKK